MNRDKNLEEFMEMRRSIEQSLAEEYSEYLDQDNISGKDFPSILIRAEKEQDREFVAEEVHQSIIDARTYLEEWQSDHGYNLDFIPNTFTELGDENRFRGLRFTESDLNGDLKYDPENKALEVSLEYSPQKTEKTEMIYRELISYMKAAVNSENCEIKME